MVEHQILRLRFHHHLLLRLALMMQLTRRGALRVNKQARESVRIRRSRGEVPERRFHPAFEGQRPRRLVNELPVEAFKSGNRAVLQRRRREINKRAARGRRSGVKPEVQIRIQEPVRKRIRHRRGEPVRLRVRQRAEERRDVDVVGRQHEGADGGDRAPEEGIHSASVEHRERIHDGRENPVDGDQNLPKRAIPGDVGEVVRLEEVVRRIRVPEFVGAVEGDANLEDRSVCVVRKFELLRLHVALVLELEPVAAVTRRSLGEREDQVRGAAVAVLGRDARGFGVFRIEVRGERDVVDASVGVVHDVGELEGEQLRRAEEHGEAGDVLLHRPHDPALRRLRGAGAENLHAAQPHGGDSVELAALARRVPSQHHERPGARAAARMRRVAPLRGRVVDCVGEHVLEQHLRADLARAVWDVDWLGHFEKLLPLLVALRVVALRARRLACAPQPVHRPRLIIKLRTGSSPRPIDHHHQHHHNSKPCRSLSTSIMQLHFECQAESAHTPCKSAFGRIVNLSIDLHIYLGRRF